ncbi:ion transporter [Paenibacillus ginsengarvi]|uniref:Ion transporter n=1 Tax=Paenibacillus ginsengarvi TaxID=400777 RepID=A0A3B0BQ33_9BACL|nr:ion transporter [Paenibacillus ginsengarvi]RKN74962.1 ion transporter [Paenibacillus ginsengarvi]
MSTSPSRFAAFVRGKAFTNFILTVVFLNAIVIGFQSYPEADAAYGSLLRGLDLLFLAVFTVEVILKLTVYRTSYFKDGWNVFDFIVVAASLLFMSSSFVSVLRILRVLRVLKTVSSIPSLRRIITSLFMAIPTIGSIALLMIIVFFIYAVIGTTYFAGISPDYFGDLGKSLITLFQIATFDDWANIYRPIAEVSPLSLLYFVTFIFIAVFVMLNLVVGEIVNNAANIQEDVADIEKEVSEVKADTSEIALLRSEVRELKLLLLEERQRRHDAAV